jgi:hypothetical protein
MRTGQTPFDRRTRVASGRRTRILVVNAYFDHLRRVGPRPRSIPQAMAPAYLAGAFARDRCEVRAYNEQHSGPLVDPSPLGWPDMLVLTGLTNAFDRMLHLAAYARSTNPHVIVVAGGPAIRALPRYARRFFDYVCTGDIEEMVDVVADALGPEYVAEEMFPRLDLAEWMGPYGYIESSRNCNYHCSFCSLTADGYGYRPYTLEFIRRQILSIGKRRFVIFIDNNFYGDDRDFFRARMALLRELHQDGRIDGWGALVTNDLFFDDENLALAKQAGCLALFSGIESFDTTVLRGFGKLQNATAPPMDMIRRCFEAGIVFAYGVILEFTTRTLAELRAEMDFIVGNTEIPLPNYFSSVIPLLQTPYFHQCLRRGLLLPSTKLRDMDTTTLTVRPLDPVDEVTAFLRDLPTLRRYRHRVPWRTVAFLRRYKRYLSWLQVGISLSGPAMLCTPSFSSGVPLRRAARRRTHLTTTEPLDSLYTPAFHMDSRYQLHFQPTMVTDANGALNEALQDDLLALVPAEPHGPVEQRAPGD